MKKFKKKKLQAVLLIICMMVSNFVWGGVKQEVYAADAVQADNPFQRNKDQEGFCCFQWNFSDMEKDEKRKKICELPFYREKFGIYES